MLPTSPDSAPPPEPSPPSVTTLPRTPPTTRPAAPAAEPPMNSRLVTAIRHYLSQYRRTRRTLPVMRQALLDDDFSHHPGEVEVALELERAGGGELHDELAVGPGVHDGGAGEVLALGVRAQDVHVVDGHALVLRVDGHGLAHRQPDL